MTREHLYPRIWKTTDLQRLNTITQLDRNAGLLVKCESRPGDCANSIYEYPLASRHGLEDLNVEHYFASQGRRFVEVFDHHLTQTPVEHIDRAKVITGSEVIDYPTMRIARLLEELSMKCKESTDYEVEMKKAQEDGARFERHWHSTCNSLADRERELMAIRAAAGYPASSDISSAAFIAIIRNIADNEKNLAVKLIDLNAAKDAIAIDAKLFRTANEDQAKTIRNLRQCNEEQQKTIENYRDEIEDLKAIVGSAGGADKEALTAIGKSLGLKETASLGEIMAAAEEKAKYRDRNDDLARWNKNQADAIKKVAKAFGCSPAASLEDIVDLAEHFEEHKACVAKLVESKVEEIKKLSSCRRELAGELAYVREELAYVREELSATNARNATQAATIREYQRQEDIADAQPDAIQDLQRRIEHVEKLVGSLDSSPFRTHR